MSHGVIVPHDCLRLKKGPLCSYLAFLTSLLPLKVIGSFVHHRLDASSPPYVAYVALAWFGVACVCSSLGFARACMRSVGLSCVFFGSWCRSSLPLALFCPLLVLSFLLVRLLWLCAVAA